MGDCAINIDPAEDDIVEITLQTAQTASVFGIDPRVALLSYSTKGSGKGDSVDKMRNATARVQAEHPELKVDGELQFDAAVAPEVGQLKAPRQHGGRLCQHLHLPGYQRGQYRLQDRPASGRF